jgi:hypothetical protein
VSEREGRELLGASDCEQLRSGPLAQPVNALSSLAFVPAGAWVAARAAGRTGWRRWEAIGVGTALVANGVGSFAYHGPQPAWSKVAHDAPIALVGGLLVVNEVGRRIEQPPTSEVLGGAQRPARVALLSGIAALAAYALGRTGSRCCRPTSRLQWHAVWHLLTAAAVASAAEARIRRG